MFGTSDLMTFNCPRCGSLRTSQLAEREGPCQKISCHHCGYEGSPFARVSEDGLIEDELSGSSWMCPNCGHYGYTISTSYESNDNLEDLGVTRVLVCTCCGYKV